MRKFLNTIKHSVCIFKDEYSFSRMNNFASKTAKGDFLLFLNDDVEIISPNWIESMLKLAMQEKVGAVGAKLLFPDGTLQEAGGIVWKDGIIWNYGRNEDPNEPCYNFVRNVDYSSGSCLLVKRDLFERIGKFDTQYEPAYCEDTDLCLSIQKEGFKVLYQPLATVIHHEGKTCGTDLNSGIKSFQIKNQKIFRKKWQQFLNSRLNDSMDDVFHERNRKGGKNILYVDHYIPEYDKDAGSLLVYYMLCTLSYLEHKVTFWPDNLVKTEPYVTNLQQKGIEVIYDGNNFESFIKKHGNVFEFCITTRAHIAPKYIDLIKKHAPQCKIVYDTVDLHFVRESREAKIKHDSNMHDQALKTKETEFQIFRNSDIIIVKSMGEANLLLKEIPKSHVAIIPTFEISPDKINPFNLRNDLLFIGGFQHPPNIDSLQHLINIIFPKIREKLPESKLFVIGSNPTQKIIDMCSETKNVVFLGYVKNIDFYLQKCKLLLAPIRFGAGVKGKITQSLAYGLVVITTSIGAEGISDKNGEILIISENDDEFIEKAVLLYNDESFWTKLSLNSKKHSEENFSPEYVKNTIEKIIAILT
ncbi:MAG: glycosyltransferase [Nitrosopumilus sp.]|nr:MAG: glycosyltransferase [Nitrosopumilus sp.]